MVALLTFVSLKLKIINQFNKVFGRYLEKKFYQIVTLLKGVSILKLNMSMVLFILKIKGTGNEFLCFLLFNLAIVWF